MSATRRPAQAVALAALLLAGTASQADTCEAVKAQIDAKIRSGGVSSFALDTVDAAASAPGRVVGNCGGGAKKIVMTMSGGGAGSVGGSGSGTGTGNVGATTGIVPVRSTARPAAPAKPADNILTECNDGSMSVGGSCKK